MSVSPAPATTDELIELLHSSPPDPEFAVEIARARYAHTPGDDSFRDPWLRWGSDEDTLHAVGWAVD
jgi:hypothetical protein